MGGQQRFQSVEEEISWSINDDPSLKSSNLELLSSSSSSLLDLEDDSSDSSDEKSEDGRSRLVALTLSLLMATILQAIRSIGTMLQDIVQTVHWDLDSQ